MKVTISTVIKEGSPLQSENPLPFFRDRSHHLPEKLLHESLQDRHKKLIGYECAKRVLPYRMQDRYGRERFPMHLKTAVLENEHLRAEFLVEYGGRLTSLFDKDNQKELVFNNPVFQPGNLAIRDAWLAVGIEFNCSQFGHHFLTCTPIYAARVTDDKGEQFLRMYEYERCKGIFYQMDFHLPSGSKFLYMYAKIINPSDMPVSTYWWTNTAIPETEKVRVFSATDEVIYYMSPEQLEKLPGYNNMAVGHIPYLDCRPGRDLSFPRNFDYSVDYFFQIPENEDMPWEAAAYEDGFVMYEVSTKALRYHKMFCWGTGSGGERWQDFLSRPGEGSYFEIQAGLAPTQGHGYILDANAVVDFVQAFGSMYCSAEELLTADWHLAQKILDNKIRQVITGKQLEELRSYYSRLSLNKPDELLNYGSGFGALELRRRQINRKPFDTQGMIFPDAVIRTEETPWLTLLESGCLPPADSSKAPVSYMVQPEWMDILKTSLEQPENRNWNSLLHYGIMQAEAGDFTNAINTFDESLKLKENVWALRNIAFIYLTDNQTDKAYECYKKLFSLPGAFSDQAFSEEYLGLLISARKYSEAWDFFKALPGELKVKDRISLLSGVAAVELNELDYVEELLNRDFSVIREGENSTSDIWFKYMARRAAAEKSIPYSNELLEEIMLNMNPPRRIDFRMQRKKRKA